MANRRLVMVAGLTAAFLMTPQASARTGEPTLGTDSADVLTGTEKSDEIKARGGNDFVRGLAGIDFISGGTGRDYLTGSRGDDAVLGGPGSDALSDGKGRDVLRAGAGNDLVVASGDGQPDVFHCGPARDLVATYGFDPDEVDMFTGCERFDNSCRSAVTTWAQGRVICSIPRHISSVVPSPHTM